MRFSVLLFALLSVVVAVGTPPELVSHQLVQLTYSDPSRILTVSNSDLSAISHKNREYFTLIVITSTDERHKCDSCHRLKEVVRRTAQVWFANYPFSELLFFVEIDVVDRTNAELFNEMRFKEVPQVWLVPPSKITEKHSNGRAHKVDEYGDVVFDNLDILWQPHAEFRLPDASVDSQVFEMADWLAKSLQKRITIQQENAQLKFVTTFVATFSLILLVKKKGPAQVTNFFSKSKIYLVMVLGGVLVLLGGSSYSKIQGVPFIAQNDKGEPIYISGGTHYQFGVEMFVVAAVYGLLVTNVAVLLWLGNYSVSEQSVIRTQKHKSVLVLVAAGALYCGYSLLLSIYLRKDGGYPYHMWKLI